MEVFGHSHTNLYSMYALLSATCLWVALQQECYNKTSTFRDLLTPHPPLPSLWWQCYGKDLISNLSRRAFKADGQRSMYTGEKPVKVAQQVTVRCCHCFDCVMKWMRNDMRLADCVSWFFLHGQGSRFVDIFLLYVLAADSSSPPSWSLTTPFTYLR